MRATAEPASRGLDAQPAEPLPSETAVLAKAGAENFPVASRALPRAERRHLMAIYGFARLVDDIGDGAVADPHAALDAIEAELDRVYGGQPQLEVMRRLQESVAERSLSREHFEALIAANRQDQEVSSYETFDELARYCELSANPVGRLVLEVFGQATPERLTLSDSICTGLQLAEHWQDVREDRELGRVYLPREDMERFGCSPTDLDAASAGPELRRLLAFEVGRADAMLRAGAPLVRKLTGRPRLAVAAFVAGGRAALRGIERAGYDVLGAAPTGHAHRARLFLGTLLLTRRRVP